MSTLSNPEIVYDLLANGGLDPLCRVYRYTPHGTGKPLFAICWIPAHDTLPWAPDVTEAVRLWVDGALTPEGQAWVEEYRWAQQEDKAHVE